MTAHKHPRHSGHAWLHATLATLAAAGISVASAHERLHLDTNGDSAVDLAELQARDPSVTPALFSSIDTDGNGLLSHQELRAGMPTLHFARLDQNGDGGVSLEEMRTRFAKLSDERFKRIDADGNGLLSKEEMTAMHRRMHRGKGHRMHRARPDKEQAAAEPAEPQE